MTNMQLYPAIGIPIIAVVASLIVSLFRISGIREDMRGVRSDVRSQISGLRDDIRSDMSGIREDVREIRSDTKLLTGKVYEMMGKQ
jgi:hypothetical protein